MRRAAPRRWAIAAVAGLLLFAVLCQLQFAEVEGEHARLLAAGSDSALQSTPAAEAIAELARLESELRRRVGRDPYIVVDSQNNRIQVRRGDELLLEGLCSAGSGIRLRESGEGRTWEFRTPRGRHRVRSVSSWPIWNKPDWAFVEDGMPIPENARARMEPGVLGEYGLAFGDGYLIHGTLYERLLGRSVSHGCVRVGREDLRKVVRLSRVGTTIFIH